MRNQTPITIAARVQRLATLPAIYDRINASINNPQSSLADVAAIIREDIGLTSRLLKMVNSAFFGAPSPVENVGSACVLMGAAQIRSMALASSVVGAFQAIPAEAGLTLDLFWRHSVGVAMAARVLALRAGENDPERFFVAGLLHDVGRLAMFQVMPQSVTAILAEARQRGLPASVVEYETYGFTHAEVGEALMNAWGLPLSLVETTACHHAPREALSFPREAAAIHLANIIAHAMGLGRSGSLFVPAICQEAWDLLGVVPETLALLVAEVDSQFEEIVNTMLGTPP